MKPTFASIFNSGNLILIFIGGVLAAIAALLIYYADIRVQSLTPTQATIIDMREVESTDSDNNSSYSFCPTVRYMTATDEIVQVALNECTAPPAYSVGDQIEIYYNPNDTAEVQIKGGTGWLVSNIAGAVLGLLGGLMCLGGLGSMAATLFAVIRGSAAKS